MATLISLFLLLLKGKARTRGIKCSRSYQRYRTLVLPDGGQIAGWLKGNLPLGRLGKVNRQLQTAVTSWCRLRVLANVCAVGVETDSCNFEQALHRLQVIALINCVTCRRSAAVRNTCRAHWMSFTKSVVTRKDSRDVGWYFCAGSVNLGCLPG